MKEFSRKRKVWIIITIVAIVATIAFIFVSSMLNKAQSAGVSDAAHGKLQALLDAIFGVGVITPNMLRKAAHVTEFLILGLEFNLLYTLIKRFNYFKVIELLSIGLAAAVIDEAIQILSDRGPMVEDVLLDFASFALACVFFVIGYAIYNAVKAKKQKKLEQTSDNRLE